MAAQPLIGITMRVTSDVHGERRDALAQDWGGFMAAVGVDWLPLPNLGEPTAKLAERLGLTGLLLSGGDDIGATPDRDETESALLTWAFARDVPVLGICRGMQFLQHWFGGGLKPLDADLHVRRRHLIHLADGHEREVNSYHRLGIAPESLAAELVPLAFCARDGSVEAVRARSFPALGILWHPEREPAPHPADVHLCRSHWGVGKPF